MRKTIAAVLGAACLVGALSACQPTTPAAPAGPTDAEQMLAAENAGYQDPAKHVGCQGHYDQSFCSNAFAPADALMPAVAYCPNPGVGAAWWNHIAIKANGDWICDADSTFGSPYVVKKHKN